MKTDRRSIVNEYLRMIVEFVNKEIKDAKETELAIKARDEAEVAQEAIQSDRRLIAKKIKERPRSRSRSSGTGRLRPVRDRSPDDPRRGKATVPADEPSCKMITAERFADLRAYDTRGMISVDTFVPDLDGKLTKMLQEIDCTPTNFRSLDYLFIPIHEKNSHIVHTCAL